MKEQIITFETAKLAQEKGFVGPMGEGYDFNGNAVLYRGRAPYPSCTQSLLQKWLRETHGVAVIIDTDIALSWIWKIYSLHPNASFQGSLISDQVWCDFYEFALEDGLLTALKLIP
jgi:hypothetical protein